MIMEDFVGVKLKRKDLDEVNDDFSDFSLSSPARKIRRLDAELPPIIEEEEAEIPLGYEDAVQEHVISPGVGEKWEPLEIEELPFVLESEEKAIVLFKPKNGYSLNSASNYSVDPNLISCFKHQALLGAHLNAARPSEEDELRKNGDDQDSNTCKAVIPWVPPSQHPNQVPSTLSSQVEVSESMEDEEMDEATMDVDDTSCALNLGQQVSQHVITHPAAIREGLQHQWPQQHCMISGLPQNTTTPIVWYR